MPIKRAATPVDLQTNGLFYMNYPIGLQKAVNAKVRARTRIHDSCSQAAAPGLDLKRVGSQKQIPAN